MQHCENNWYTTERGQNGTATEEAEDRVEWVQQRLRTEWNGYGPSCTRSTRGQSGTGTEETEDRVERLHDRTRTEWNRYKTEESEMEQVPIYFLPYLLIFLSYP
ncbi:hypothetical protein Pmani_006349 [Petrolisthes manimaculis]|uniref:Uncharacterized protein n=1 Tax=Petrolisthes manimaculis TaxID=1843537 RepID=A0AAE1QAI3_9EUCA|nr:hypothetical protein Pmani_006349 [Petrolisthes manimaculis]